MRDGRPMGIGASGYYSRQDWGIGWDVDGWAVATDWRIPLPSRLELSGEFYRGRLAEHGVTAEIPGDAERTALHAIIYDELVQGRIEPASKAAVIAMTERAAADGADGVILGCTEITLLIGPADVSVSVKAYLALKIPLRLAKVA